MQLCSNKFDVLGKKMRDMTDIADEFHESTDKLEKLFYADIQRRKQGSDQVA
jgi:predicted nuclease of restriction endonuclease-like RecB superfamily